MMKMNSLFKQMYIMIFCFFAVVQGPAIHAQKEKKSVEGLLNQLIAPGPLMEGHKDFEHKDCLKCHEPLGGVPNKKCLDCHKEIKSHIDIKKHFHGFNRNKDCIQCHKDHKGRNYNAVYVDQKNFDHKQTGFILDGAHASVKCAECHTDKRKEKPIRRNEIRYFGTKNSCNFCHAKDDVHYFKGSYAKKECSTCHSTVSWKDNLRFNHSRDTGYRLLGAHARMECKDCHAPSGPKSAKYQWPQLKSKACLSCHKDHHGSNLSLKYRNGQCSRCHTQERWSIEKFNHEVTGWPLQGAHQKTRCIECHDKTRNVQTKSAQFVWVGLKTECKSCHVDYHGFSKQKSPLSKSPIIDQCSSCHNSISFKNQIRFDHDRNSRFMITGKHKKNACFDCHVTLRSRQAVKGAKPNEPRQYYWPALASKTCENCHKSAHSASFHRRFKGKTCDSCHNTSGWMNINSSPNSPLGRDSKFHDDTRFPLTGSHKKASCDSCHLVNGKSVYRFPNARKKFCINCHDNVHKKQFSRKFSARSCNDCHTTVDFEKLKPFDHDQTSFRLTGNHVKIANKCEKCHVPTNEILPTKPPKKAGRYQFPGQRVGFCQNCHANQHRDMFSSKFYRQPCFKCHTTSGFDRLRSFNHDQTAYPLRGKHRDVKCRECHVPTRKRYKTEPFRRKGRYQFPGFERRQCITCHENIHKPSRGDNCKKCHTVYGWKNADGYHKDFTLVGAHLKLSCDNCHINDRMLKGSSEDCRACHIEEDVHNGQLNQCSDCHRQNFWQVTSFNHNTTRFPLIGSHRLVDCRSCHGQGVYQGLPQDCVSCHFQDAARVEQPLHSSARFQQCENCHNTFIFSGAVQGN